MKTVRLGLAGLLAWSMVSHAQSVEPWIYIDFNTAMQTASFLRSVATTQQVVGIEGTALMHCFKSLYDANNPSRIKPSSALRIPKIIHHVWLGSEVPDEFKEFMQSWIDMHMEGWQYFLWTDEEVAKIKLFNQKFYDATDNYGVKSDIVKWEVVYRYGGVYVDTDFECLKPLDILHYTYDFYTGIQPLDTQFVQLGAALFGAVPGHPILKHCIETIKDDWHHKGAPTKTGPVHFTKSFFAVAGKSDLIDIAFPAYYFYPQGCQERALLYDSWKKNGAYAIHHWAKSWMPKQFRSARFKTITNDASVQSWND